jgi:hypothetical protein
VRAERELKDRVAKLHERLPATQQDFHLTPEHILMAVKTGLALAGRPPLEPFALPDARQEPYSRCPRCRARGHAVLKACATPTRCKSGLSPSITRRYRT